MKSNRSAEILLSIYLITMLGSNLTTVSAFISIESTLGTVNSTAFALAIRTVGFFLSSYMTPFFLNRFGEKKTLVLAQISGFFALALLWVGFKSHSAPLIYLGVVATGLPANVMMTSTVATLKHLIIDATLFRHLSARRELYAGSTLALAGLTSPWLVDQFGLETVFILDTLTYTFALLGLYVLRLPSHKADAEFPVLPHPRAFLTLQSKKFFLSVSGSLALMATLPMIASSPSIRELFQLPSNLFRSMWAIEGLVGIVASAIYSRLILKHESIAYKYICGVNGLFFIPLVLPIPALIKFFFLCLIPLCYSIAFFEARDTLLIQARTDRALTSYYASFASITRSIWGTLSPFVITIGFQIMNVTLWIAIIIFIQLSLLALTSKARGGRHG